MLPFKCGQSGSAKYVRTGPMPVALPAAAVQVCQPRRTQPTSHPPVPLPPHKPASCIDFADLLLACQLITTCASGAVGSSSPLQIVHAWGHATDKTSMLECNHWMHKFCMGQNQKLLEATHCARQLNQCLPVQVPCDAVCPGARSSLLWRGQGMRMPIQALDQGPSSS
jgi:hypothetical protein